MRALAANARAERALAARLSALAWSAGCCLHYFVRVGDNNPNADLQTEWDQPLEGVRAVNDDD